MRARLPFVIWLSIAQTVSWGSLYYAFPLFLEPIAAELGWSLALQTGAYTCALLVSGLAAPVIGLLLDRFGGHGTMTFCSVLAAIFLASLGFVQEPWHFFLIWGVLGLAMAGTFYEPAFAVLMATLGDQARRGITIMTLIAGFAGTVFFPLTHLFIELLGWRDALLALGLLNLVICVPIHGVILRREKRAASNEVQAEPHRQPFALGQLRPVLRNRVFWLLAVFIMANSVLMSALTVHIIPMLREATFEMGQIIVITAMIGPMQVAGRLVIALFERWINFRVMGLIATLLPLSALLAVAFAKPGNFLVFAYPILWGAGNGIVTIVRAMAVPELIGSRHYGAINGMLTLVSSLARAVGPFMLSAVWLLGQSYDAPIMLLFAVALVCAGSFWLTTRVHAARIGPNPAAKSGP